MGKESLAALDTRLEERRTPSEMISPPSFGDEAGEENLLSASAFLGRPLRINAVPRRTSAATHTIVQPKSRTETDRQQEAERRLMSYPTRAPGSWHGQEVSPHAPCGPGHRRDTPGVTSPSAAHSDRGSRRVRVGLAGLRRHRQQVATHRQLGLPVAIPEKAKMADALKPPGQDMQRNRRMNSVGVRVIRLCLLCWR